MIAIENGLKGPNYTTVSACACGTVCPQQYGQLVDEPAHGTHQPAEEQAFAGARKQDGKAQGADPCNEELRRQLSDLCTGEHHATTTPVKNV